MIRKDRVCEFGIISKGLQGLYFLRYKGGFLILLLLFTIVVNSRESLVVFCLLHM